MWLVLRALQVKDTSVSAELTQDGGYQHLLKSLDLKMDKLSATEVLLLKELLGEYQHVFAIGKSELSSTSLVEHHIDTGHSNLFTKSEAAEVISCFSLLLQEVHYEFF